MSNFREERPGTPTPEPFGTHHRQHADLVRAFRQHLKANEELARRLNQSPEEWIGLDLFRKWHDSPLKGPREEFFEPLFFAWNVLAYDSFTPGSGSERTAARIMADFCRTPTIRLSDSQVRVIDALTEVVGIRHPREQNEIEIPEKYRDFDRWTSSQEYQERVARANQTRGK